MRCVPAACPETYFVSELLERPFSARRLDPRHGHPRRIGNDPVHFPLGKEKRTCRVRDIPSPHGVAFVPDYLHETFMGAGQQFSVFLRNAVTDIAGKRRPRLRGPDKPPEVVHERPVA